MNISESGIADIKVNEGFSGLVYDDNGKPCIGYGHDLASDESFPDGISESEADAILRTDLATRFEPTVNRLVPGGCTQNQYDALCDFAYNLGCGPLEMMLSHGWSEVPVQIPRWMHKKNAQGVEVEDKDLVARRAKEVKLFQTP